MFFVKKVIVCFVFPPSVEVDQRLGNYTNSETKRDLQTFVKKVNNLTSIGQILSIELFRSPEKTLRKINSTRRNIGLLEVCLFEYILML